MTNDLHTLAVQSFAPMLRSLSGILAKTTAQAGELKLDLEALPQASLAPDMFPLARQVQLACVHAASGVSRLMGQEPADVGEAGRTLDALKAQIERTVAQIEGAAEAAFAGAEQRTIVIPGPPRYEFAMSGAEFLRDWALPHFYFHLVTAYDILRHEGVQIGKQDYLSSAGRYLRPSA